MRNQPKDGVDRRDFMKTAMALVGASTALVTQVGPAHAQGANAPAAGAATGARQRTLYTGDVIDGKKVINALDVDDLPRGAKHMFYFQGVQMPTGQHWYVSVIVVRGAKPGKRVALISGVHGDEISPVHTIQTVVSQLDPARMSGTVLAVLDVSRPALEAMERRWPNSGRGIDLIDINREWPGNENGPSAPSRHAGLLFNRLLRPNADYAIDFHTGTTGMDLTSFNLARMELPEARAMAELYPIAQIFDNPAYPTLLANALINVGIPAITPEIGVARVLDLEMIPLFVEGTMNVLKRYGVVPGPMGRTGRDVGIFVGNSGHTILTTHGGFVELLVKLNDKVAAGQKVAVQRNTFGEVVAQYTSSVTGEVTGRRTDATAEPGIPIVMILYQSASRENPEDYSE
ncbi:MULTISPECIES: succinylglutamate desuccinylase/aspartoacylase family protein [Paraburkholderia]|uniref:Succinylglutamate desuccinylase/aspartoacylase family protein n=1 Tax=Paraburkholderia podalyriae TaxID=1938811 RepID=A0ABR7PPQ3_9BURK|nr:succinylglutamate desuccinylase/aspartoacylase family protein [Paraburkholderia podalyriae]MBC8748267.1 succinylglutamate desuccinylase/aspartoacylase family protein [Paraburkholderia podalyriae]